MIFTVVRINIRKQIIHKHIFPYFDNLKYTPSDKITYPCGYIYPKQGTLAVVRF